MSRMARYTRTVLRLAAGAISLLVFAVGISWLSLGPDVPLAGASGAALVLFSGVAFWLLVQSSPRNLNPSFSAKVRPYLALFCVALPLITLLASLDVGIVSPLEWAGVAFAAVLAFVLFLALRTSFSREVIGRSTEIV